MKRFVLPLLAVLLASCSKTAASDAPPAATAEAPRGSAPGAAAVGERAELGKPAPDFTLTDLDGRPVRLADFRGKTVVLEWFNPECPFVRAAHTKGSLRDTAKRATARGVVWIAINSAAPGKQGREPEKNKAAKAAFGLDHPIAFDDAGEVGRAYGATNTPHMFVIDGAGKLVYRGAIDNSPDGEGESPSDGRLVNYVDAALDDLAAGRPIAKPETKAYGCSVKYAAR